eukprot:TRINITY_DN2202_c0_g1_i3.p1 TRINITY_DN2202_c0_g1~~TRINITY_DN2202_c0_g1_i3.p1  ORF type:complete len:614 (+),score=229.50 TRINITY_DN2202_c0_g1_i3:106-1842(+)
MGDFMGKLFVDPMPDANAMPDNNFGFFQVIFHGLVYAYILFHASGMISEGSELLLLTPARGLVGSVVLPVLGAVPDGAIILFSGATQKNLSVGVGALAGSTIMLLTVPWFLAVLAGRVTLDAEGSPDYTTGRAARLKMMTPGAQITGTGAKVDASIKQGAVVMLITACTYLVIQIPAFMSGCGTQDCGCAGPSDTNCIAQKASDARPFALGGLIVAFLMFLGYLIREWANLSPEDDKHQRRRFKVLLHNMQKSPAASQAVLRSLLPDDASVPAGAGESAALQGGAPKKIYGTTPLKMTADFVYCMKQLFNLYNKNKTEQAQEDGQKEQCIDSTEIGAMENELHWPKTLKEKLKAEVTKDGLTLKELQDAVWEWMTTPGQAPPADGGDDRVSEGCASEAGGEEEEEEVPEDIADLPREEQQAAIWKRSLTMMGVGTLVVIFFSDPMCDILSSIGDRVGINSFYIAFVMAPLASNASELLAAYSYALKKTEKTMTIALSSLIGAACMNNTFCLSIFLFQIYSNSLIWEFTAETISIILVELLMFGIALQKVQKLWMGIIVISLFPLSVLLVMGLEAAGLD